MRQTTEKANPRLKPLAGELNLARTGLVQIMKNLRNKEELKLCPVVLGGGQAGSGATAIA